MSILNEIKDKTNPSQTIKESFPEIQNIKDDVASLARNVRSVSNDTAHAATDYMYNRMNDFKNSGQVTLDKIESHVKSKPSQSIAVAFVLGLAASYLLGRRSS